MAEYKMCANEEMAIYILDFIKRGYEKSFQDAGVQKYVEALQMGIDALRTSKGWIDVNERLPEENTHVIIATDDGHVFGCLYTYDGWDLWEGNEVNITHWQPFPESPKERGDLE